MSQENVEIVTRFAEALNAREVAEALAAKRASGVRLGRPVSLPAGEQAHRLGTEGRALARGDS